MTKAEKKLWYDYLKKSPYKFYRQRLIDHYIVDFYCSELRLVIEVDGSHHYIDNYIEYDSVRSELLESYGLSVLRFSNNDVLLKFKVVCNEIEKFGYKPETSFTKQTEDIVYTFKKNYNKGIKTLGESICLGKK